MPISWTSAQLAAIDTKEKTLLVSAAAGAGKTAALTERLIRRLTDPQSPASLDRMLIVTFTRAAASELRERIGKALSDALAKNPLSRHLSRQIVMLSEARICTIDAFLLDVVRSNFSLVGLPPKFRMADSAELAVLKNTVMEELIGEFYEKGEEYGHFFDHFSDVRSDRNLAKVFHAVYDAVLKYPAGIDFLKENALSLKAAASEDYFRSSFGAVSLSGTEALLAASIAMYENALAACESYEPMQTAYGETFRRELAYCRVLLESLKGRSYRETRELILGFEAVRLPSIKRGKATEESARFSELRKSFTSEIKALKDTRFLLSAEDISRSMQESAEISHTLWEFLSRYDTRIREEKLRRAVCDFDDITRYAYSLLIGKDGTPTPLASAYRERFDEIYIDEYQDVDSVQDLIFSAIARPDNRFLVGDIKQSIYGFRGANPSVFASYRERFPAYGTAEANSSDCTAVYMSENFRCDSPIIHFTNTVCGTLFSSCTGGLSYRREDDLIYKKPDTKGYTAPPVEVVLLSGEAEAELTRRIKKGETDEVLPTLSEEPEAAYIVSRIRALLKDGKKADGSPILPRDIAVLARGNATLLTIAKELQKAGIESCISAEEEFFENPEVLLLLSLLNTIDNPRRDVYLTATLRSPLYGFTLDELVRIRKASDESLSLYDALLAYTEAFPQSEIAEKSLRFTENLNAYRTLALSLPVDRLIRQIFMDPILSIGGGLSAALPESRHLLRLYEYARQFEFGAFRGLQQFVAYIERLIADRIKMDLPAMEKDNAVRLMTIHKSKGLEFPVCFLANADRRFRLKENGSPILIAESLGAAMKLSDESGFGRINTPMRDAITAYCTEKEIEEEMRVLYVALTRARERLILTTHPFGVTAFEKKVDGRVLSPSRFSIMEGHSYLAWILYALKLHPEAKAYTTLSTVETLSIPPTTAEEKTTDSAEASYTEEEVEAYLTHFRSLFRFEYPESHLSRIPAKMSVSRLSPDALDESETEPPRFPDPDTGDSAKRGTATHCFLQFCDFALAKKNGARSELDRLTRERFLSPDTAELCRVEELDRFFESDLFQTLCHAKKIYREQRFNIFLPAANFSRDTEFRDAIRSEQVLVQGVIDIFFVDGDGKIVLCDYKTDRLSKEELTDDTALIRKMRERHGEQLSYYALAIEQMMGRKPDRILVYATAAGRAVEV